MKKVSVRLVFDRKRVATKSKKASVQIEVLYDQKRKYFSTGVQLFSDQWAKDRVKNHPLMGELNERISIKLSSIMGFINSLERENSEFSFEKLGNFLDPSVSNGDFLAFMEKRIDEREVRESTKIRQKSVLKALHEFGRIKTFSDITLPTIKLYDEFARKKCTKQSAVYNYHKTLKTFVREAFAFEYIKFNPYTAFKLSKGETRQRKYLIQEELDKIESKEIKAEYLTKTRDVFIFCCYTGLAYSDLSAFNFREAVFSSGKYRIRDARQKTGSVFNITLLEKAMNILRKYDFNLPIISNAKYNLHLKVLGEFCGINKKLTSHVARHTFATTITLAHGIRIEVVSKMLGHTNIKTTQIYAHVLQKEVDEAFDKLDRVV